MGNLCINEKGRQSSKSMYWGKHSTIEQHHFEQPHEEWLLKGGGTRQVNVVK